jgi:hypothetical protein
MVQCYSHPLQERFLASRWSIAYLFRVCWYIALAISPIYIAYSSGSFWKRDEAYYEQPDVTFSKEYIVVVRSADGAPVLHASSIEKYNQVVGYPNVRLPTVKVSDTDKQAKQ